MDPVWEPREVARDSVANFCVTEDREVVSHQKFYL